MKWNKVEDGLPKTDIDVLVTDGNVIAAAINNSYSAWEPINVDVTYDMAGVVLDMGEITHWAEMPELPAVQPIDLHIDKRSL